MHSRKNVIEKHNSKIMEYPESTSNKTCRCGQKSDCPLNQNCLSECLVYNAVVNVSTMKNYHGTCEKRASKRDITITRHHLETNHVRKVQSFLTTYWEFKENDENYTIDWLIAMKAHPYIFGTRICDLRLCEKLLIARANSASY